MRSSAVTSAAPMQGPDHVRQLLATRFARQHRRWFAERQQGDPAGPLAWPLTLVLGRPVEQDLIADHARVREWVASWERFGPLPSGVQIEWTERQWPRLGRQRLPERLVLASAQEVAHWVDAGGRWGRACERADRLVAVWPLLRGNAVLGRVFDALADCADDDFDRLMALLVWADANPASGLYLRQLPVPGLDTKWIASRSGVVTELLRATRQAGGDAGDSSDLRALLGLRRVEARMRVRLLCPRLRQRVGGLEDLELPVSQLAGLDIAPRTVLIVENLDTGLALPDIPGVLAVMKLGAAVKLVAQLPWTRRAECLYWGDIDTFGFEILNRARSVLPHVRSVLMDAGTLLDHRSLCVHETAQVSASELPLLTREEHEVFDGLRGDRWGERLRLEQERIPWPTAVQRLLSEVGNTSKPQPETAVVAIRSALP